MGVINNGKCHQRCKEAYLRACLEMGVVVPIHASSEHPFGAKLKHLALHPSPALERGLVRHRVKKYVFFSFYLFSSHQDAKSRAGSSVVRCNIASSTRKKHRALDNHRYDILGIIPNIHPSRYRDHSLNSRI